MSREHAEIIRTAGGFAIRDLGSTNGTLVNGKRADKQRLGDGDLILIADVEFTFRLASEAAPGRTVTQIMPGDHAGENPEDCEENVPLDLMQAFVPGMNACCAVEFAAISSRWSNYPAARGSATKRFQLPSRDIMDRGRESECWPGWSAA